MYAFITSIPINQDHSNTSIMSFLFIYLCVGLSMQQNIQLIFYIQVYNNNHNKFITSHYINILYYMNPQSFISDTLQLPSDLPLFKYNVNFSGVKKLLQQSNIQINSNTQQIKQIHETLKQKYTYEEFNTHSNILNHSIKFGINIQKYIDNQENKFMQFNNVSQKGKKNNTEEFGYKISKMNEIVDYLLLKTQQNQTKLNDDDKKYHKLIDDSFHRLSQHVQSSVESFSKIINNYFNQLNIKISALQSDLNMSKSTQQTKINQFQIQLNHKISENSLNNSLESHKHSILKLIQTQIQNDQMKRLANLEQYKTQIKQLQKNSEIQNKVMKQKINQLETKVTSALNTKIFDMQKHKIYEKLSQFKNKTEQLARKNNQFYDFRKGYLTQKEKMKQDIIGFDDQLKKLNDKQSSFKKMENVSDILSKLDPHLLCEIENQVKLHAKQIGKLQKNIIQLQSQSQNNLDSKQLPQVNTGQNSDLVQKIIKQYMTNMSFQIRVKKVEKDIVEVSRRTDVFNDLEKKIYTLSKDLDTSAIMKELKKKCDEENTKKQVKILDSKIESLFDYFKSIRKQLDIVYKRTAFGSTKQSTQTPSLTSKKLISANCISCPQPASSSKKRVYSRKRIDYSFDESHDYLKSATYNKLK